MCVCVSTCVCVCVCNMYVHNIVIQMITRGGDAELDYVDGSDSPFQEGIRFTVRPPKKSWKYIQNLSGGERTLSSLALVFALHHLKPTPVYFMDEIDAALDYSNVSIIAAYIKNETKNAQFIIISLRDQMFEISDRMVGIYKTHDVTKSRTIDPHKFGAEADARRAAAAAAAASTATSSSTATTSGTTGAVGAGATLAICSGGTGNR
eukprot:GHVQ01006191.1.p1 GENE.GHVQ01006191.1~~GHVQ01006191.1.p1  ORF type:complete len:207 (+),score=34.52 GHVQ01006191.1:337-957(+)